MPSLGLGYIASVLRENNHEVKILNCIKERFTFNSFSEYVIKINMMFMHSKCLAMT